MIINVELSQSSISKAIEKLKKYRDSLKLKNELFLRRLAETGIAVIDARIAEAEGDSDKSHDVTFKVHSYGDYSQGTLTLMGNDILFIEFGSGIHYNSSNPEHASKFGYGVGTYPGQTHAFDPEGWWYRDSTGVAQHSYGTQATMPMLSASRAMILTVRQIAREVYGSN